MCDISKLLFPFCYTSTSELSGYRQRIIAQIVNHFADSPHTQGEYKDCPVFKCLFDEAFQTWFSAWGEDDQCEPEEGAVRPLMNEMYLDEDVYDGMIQASMSRFVGIVSEVVERAYNTRDDMYDSDGENQLYYDIQSKFKARVAQIEQEADEAYGIYDNDADSVA